MSAAIISDDHKLAQVVVVLKAKVRAGAMQMPLCVDLANGAHEGWLRAAHEYLIARREGRSYTPATVETPNWEEDANE